MTIRIRVAGSFCRITSLTGRWRKNEVPQVPVTIDWSHLKYWTWTGWSRPHWWMIASLAASLIPRAKAKAARGPPGISCIPKKSRAEIRIRVGIDWRMRRPMYPSIWFGFYSRRASDS